MSAPSNSILSVVDAYELLPDAILIIDEKGTILHHNSRTLKVFRYEENELTGKPLNILMPDRFQQHHQQHVQEYFKRNQTRKMGSGLKLWGKRRDGEEFDLDIALSTIEHEGGRFAIAVIREIGDKLQLEQRIGSLEKIKEELERFAYVVTHDLKVPLQRIKMLTHLITAEFSEHEGQEMKTMINYLNGSVTTMEKLIYGVLEYAKAGNEEANVPVDLNDVLDEILRTISIPLNFVVRKKKPLPTVTGNYTKLMQVFLNLITNAVKYNTASQGILEIDASVKDSFHIIRFTDNGIVIPVENREHIFKLFHRGTSHADDRSHGIGLSIVQKIIDQGGGKIWYEESSMGGSCFVFTWPVMDDVTTG